MKSEVEEIKNVIHTDLKNSLYFLITKIIKKRTIDASQHGRTKINSRIYISGPITDMPDLNRSEFLKYESSLLASGYEPINPHKLTEGLDITDWTWEDFMTIDIPYMLLCDTVVCLEGWQSSKGARVEIGLAYLMKKKILVAKNMKELDYHFVLKPEIPL